MRFTHIVGTAFLSALWVVSLVSCNFDHDQSTLLSKPEALTWLKENRNPLPLAGSRFDTAASAREFVERLYAAGAMRVVVDGIRSHPEFIEQERGPYADTIIVEMPARPELRADIFRFAAEEAKHEGFPPPLDHGQKQLVFWWF